MLLDEEGRPAEARGEATTTEDDASVTCAACDAVVARVADRTERFGAHEHDRMNPAGYTFRIACFTSARGAAAIGAPSNEFPWFPRAAWQVALCAACGAHLGWRFSGESVFWGLRVDAIRSAG